MSDGGFKFANCLLKHFVRTDGWLPVCKKRRREVNAIRERRLRYLTFCAVDAIDVLMLDVAKILIKSQQDKFDTVCFFDRDPQHVIDTQKSIPGAIGIPGKFVETVLAVDPDAPEQDGVNESQPLAAEANVDDTSAGAKGSVC